MSKTSFGAAIGLVAVLSTAAPGSAQNNFVTFGAPDPQAPPLAQQLPQQRAVVPAERQTMDFAPPAYTPNASAPAAPVQGAQVAPYDPAYAEPVQIIPAPAYRAPVPLDPAPVVAEPAPMPVAAPEPAPASLLPAEQVPAVQPAPAQELRFQTESDTSRTLLALEDVYRKQVKALETAHQAKKTALLDKFEKEAEDPDKVVGLADRLRAAMATLEDGHKRDLAEEERRYIDARLKVLAASPSRLQQ